MDTTLSLIVNNNANEKCDFETAITATGYGKFNYFLFLIAIFASFASSFSTTALAYVVPVAECDLSLSLADKGMLNGCYYLGTLGSVFFWGFLADAYGRRKLQIWGQMIDTLCSIGCAFSTSFHMLFVFKLLGGFIGCGPHTIMMSYLAEFHSTKYRPRVMVYAGVFLALANAVLSFIAWYILPMDFTYHFTNTYVLSSWRVFLLLCSVPSLLAGIGNIILPESPKFLMYSGRNQEALKVFQNIYHWNTGKLKESYPYKTLVNETIEDYNASTATKMLNSYPTERKGRMHSLRVGLQQTKTMFFPPYLKNFILVIVIQTGSMMGTNTFRVWLPQLFATIDTYVQIHNNTSHAAMCDILEYATVKQNINVGNETCTVILVQDIVYINSIVVCLCALLGFLFVSRLISVIGSRKLLIAAYGLCTIFGFAIYWSSNVTATLVLSSMYIMFAGIAIQVGIAVIVELFPTSLRTMVMSMTLVIGRIGSMSGSLMFPALMELACFPIFLFIGGTCLLCGIACLFLPKKTPEFK